MNVTRTLIAVVSVLVCGALQAQVKDPITVTVKGKDGKVKSKTIIYDARGCGTVCDSSRAPEVTVSVTRSAQPTTTWQQPLVVTQVVSQVVTQYTVVEKVIERPVISEPVVQAPVVYEQPVVYSAPRTVYYSTPYVMMGASVGVYSYGNSYPATYWQYNNRRTEQFNYRNTQRMYGLGSSHGRPAGYRR